MSRIYISYRLEDANAVRLIVQRCLQTYGRYSVITNPEESKADEEQLVRHIDNLMHTSHSILLIIGKGWAGIDEFGRFKLSSADIPVGEEIRVALRSGKEVFVVLVNGAKLPFPDDVPEDIHEIFSLPVFELRPESFVEDLNRLIQPPTLFDILMYYVTFAWTKNYIRSPQVSDYEEWDY